MSGSAGPLEARLEEIEAGIEHKLYYTALLITLTMPDVCAALENARAFSGRDEYKKWYRDNLGSSYPFLSDDDCYSLRCGVVHKAEMALKTKTPYSRVVFSLPGRAGIFHNNVMNDALQLDATAFCQDMICSVRDWYIKEQHNPIVISNISGLVTYYPNGLAPYLLGHPMIA